CNFQQFIQSIEALNKVSYLDVVFAESVGSCTDLVATIIKPLQKFYENIDIVLSVFADIRLLSAYLMMNKDIFHGKMNYVYEKQLEEADIIVVNKIDMLNEEKTQTAKDFIRKENWTQKVLYQNSLDSSDIRRWLTIVNHVDISGLRKSLDLNYDDYALGEAEMCWYDNEVEIISQNGSAVKVCYELAHSIYDKIKEHNFIIGHLKFLISDEVHHVKVSFTTIPSDENYDFSPFGDTNRATILINGRIKANPEAIIKIISNALTDIQSDETCSVKEKHPKVFNPAYPKPTYRITS
ncbi:MAG: GTP-binding protein, partial [Rhabdochlamydiaceae bacterium]